MELPLLAIFLASFALTHSHPKQFDVIAKDYYKRQILQPIPGYIPVYIKTDEEPIVRSEIKNPSASVPMRDPQQGNEHKEKNSFKQADEKTEKNAEPNLDEIKSEGAVKESKNVSGKPEPPASLSTPSEKHDEFKP